MTHFTVLGTLKVTHGDQDCTPTPPKMRSVLALLLLSPNRVVPMDSLIEELWAAAPPPSALTTVQTYIYHLRRVFAAKEMDPPGRPLLVTKHPGYLFRIDLDQVDAERFEGLVRRGRKLLEADQPAAAATVLEEALGMWTGPALADVLCGDLLQAHAIHLEERRINAIELRIEADIKLGRHRELVAELKSLVRSHPLNEWFHSQLIHVLSYSGRRGEALQAYQNLRTILRNELGVDPSPAMQRLQNQLLSAGIPERPGRPGLAGAATLASAAS